MLVSILSPVKNEETFIDEMIASVKTQTHVDWELIFVNDGSTDLTEQHILEAAQEDSRIRFTGTGESVGKSAAFNLAFTASRGEVIILLAGDDRLPPNSLQIRLRAFEQNPNGTVGLFKLRSFSADPRFNSLEIPKGKRTSSSGGVMALSRDLAEQIFPIPTELPSEDLWLGFSAPRIAETVVRIPEVVLEYRIHDGNSNPRNRPFQEMAEKMASRHRAWPLLLQSNLPFDDATRRELRSLADVERLRKSGSFFKILREDLPLATRLGYIAMCNPRLYHLRMRFYGLFTGWTSQ